MKCENQILYNPIPPVSTLLNKTESVLSSASLVIGKSLEPENSKKLLSNSAGHHLTKKQKELRLKQSENKLRKCIKI